MNIGIRRNKAGVFEKYNTMFLKKNNYNVLFLGSSRTEMHFDPKLFDSITGSNSYNIGVTGATPRIAFKILKAYCSKSSLPDYLIFDVDIHFLKYGFDIINHFPRYFPYLKNEVLLEEFNQIDDRFKQFKYNPFYSLPYSNINLLSVSLHGWLNIPGKYDTCYYKGFAGTVRGELETLPVKRFYTFFNVKERQYLDSIINFSKKNNVKLLLITSPMFGGGKLEMINKPQITAQIKNIAISNGINYLDFSEFAPSNKRQYYIDYYHMTSSGANAFTREFSLHFSQYFDKKTVK